MAQGESQNSVWTPANKVTFARIVFIPVFVAILISPWPQYFPDWMHMGTLKPWLAAAVFIVLSLTDMIDGYLARSRGEVTDFGKFMDPLADKLLVSAALLALIELDVLPSWVVLVIIAREFIVSGVRMVAASKGEVIAASMYGKVKTVLQMVAIVLFIIKDSHVITDFNALWHDGLYLFSWVVMLAAVVMTIVSMVDYVYKARYLLGLGRVSDPVDSVQQATVEMTEGMDVLAASVLEHARRLGLTIATAESCTGGLIAGVLTSIAGSSDVVLGGVVSYANSVKQDVLGVSEDTLETVGAVSKETACQMALGALERTGADLAVSVTGIAGPGGAVAGKPVGTVWIGIADSNGARAKLSHFDGNRDEVRAQAVEESLRMLEEALYAK